MTREQQIAHWAPIVSAVFRAEDNIKAEWLPRLQEAKNAENNIPDEEKQALVAARGTGESLERRAIERYIRAVATEIVEHGGMAFDGDDNEREIEPYNV